MPDSSFGSSFTNASFASNNSAFANTFFGTQTTYTQPTNRPTTTPITDNPTSTGIDPQAYEAILYGKDRSLYVGGLIRIGGRICEGPFFSGTQSDPLVSFISYHAQTANPGGDQEVIEVDLRGAKYWDTLDGYVNPGVLGAGQLDWRNGTETQLPFQSSIDRFGTSADAYRSGILVEIRNLPLRPFGGIIPFPSVVVLGDGADSDGITRQEAISRLLRFMRLSDDEFEVDVPGVDQAWMVATQIGLIPFLQSLRSIFTNWSITYGDKLRITDTTQFPVSCVMTQSNVVRNSMRFKKTDPLLIPRQRLFTYIDVDRDYEPQTAPALAPLYPTPTTESVESSSVELGIVMTNAEASALAHSALFEEEAIRSQLQANLQPELFGTMPGDVAQFADHDFITFLGRVFQTKHDFQEWTVAVDVAEVLNCGAAGCPEYDLTAPTILNLRNASEYDQITVGAIYHDDYIYTINAFADAARVNASTFSAPEYLDTVSSLTSLNFRPWTDGTYVYTGGAEFGGADWVIIRFAADFNSFTQVANLGIAGGILLSPGTITYTETFDGYLYMLHYNTSVLTVVNTTSWVSVSLDLADYPDADLTTAQGMTSDGERYLFMTFTSGVDSYFVKFDTQSISLDSIYHRTVAGTFLGEPTYAGAIYAPDVGFHDIYRTDPSLGSVLSSTVATDNPVNFTGCRYDGCRYVYVMSGTGVGDSPYLGRIDIENGHASDVIELTDTDNAMWAVVDIVFDGEPGSGEAHLYPIALGNLDSTPPRFPIAKMNMF